jgi:glycerol uptake facilitator-like aquaporin
MLNILLLEFVGTFIFFGVIITCGYENIQKNDTFSWIKIMLAFFIVGFITGSIINPALCLMLYMNNNISFEKMCFSIFGQIIAVIFVYFCYKYIKKYKKI